MNNLLIADDHSAIRKGVRYILLEEYPNLEVGDAVDTAEAIRMLTERKWDAIILDIDLPGRGGLEVLHYIRKEALKIPVLIFSFHRESQIAIRALKSGASGYLSKDSADTELIKAIKVILAGGKYISPFISEQLVLQVQLDNEKLPHEQLSNREFEVFMHIAAAKTLTQIAQELSLSKPTISTYRARIMEKLGIKTNAQIMEYAIRNNLR